MARLCDLADPNVNVLYIAPYPLERETMAYYSSLLATAGIHNVDGRVDVMHPGARPHSLAFRRAP